MKLTKSGEIEALKIIVIVVGSSIITISFLWIFVKLWNSHATASWPIAAPFPTVFSLFILVVVGTPVFYASAWLLSQVIYPPLGAKTEIEGEER